MTWTFKFLNIYIYIYIDKHDKVLREVSKEKSAAMIWNKLKNLYMTKSLGKHVILEAKIVHPQDDNREVAQRSFG